MRIRERANAVVEKLTTAGYEAEVFVKTGRSRRYDVHPTGRFSCTSEENGWAVRASLARASFFCAGTGLPDPTTTWPEPDGRALVLPRPEEIPQWSPPADLGHAMVAESEAMAILEGVEKALTSELPGSRLIRGVLEEGSSESWICSSRGIGVEFRSRAATVMVEAAGPWSGTSSVSISHAARESRALQPGALASRLVNRLVLTHEGTSPTRERGEMLLAAPVAARLLYSLMPLFLGSEGLERARRFRDRQGRIGNRLLQVVDDGRLPGGVLESPVDGEGRPTGPRTVIEEGRLERTLIDWRQTDGQTGEGPGCMRRESWRDLPVVGPSHLYLEPRSPVGVGELLGSIGRGYYLIEPLGAAELDLEGDSFRLPVCGFELQQGRAVAPLSRVWIEGAVSSLLHGVRAVGRDLTFYPLGAMIGAPSLLLSGFGLRGAP